LLVTCLAPLSATAQSTAWPGSHEPPDDDWNAPGWYLRLGGVYGLQTRAADSMQPVVAGFLPGIDVSVEDSAGFDGRLGRRLLPYLAAEFQIDYLAGFDVNSMNVTVLTYRELVATANLKLIAPLGRLQPYGLVGLGISNSWLDTSLASLSDDSFFGGAFRGGGGVDLFILPKLAFSAEASYVLPIGETEKLDYVSLSFGFLYTF
jgi:opacity protein-like surface antigen